MDSSDATSAPGGAYLFECKGIQRYIFGSGRLRQVIGASDLVAGVARSDGEDMLSPVFEAVGIENPVLSRRAGAAFCAHADEEALARFRRLWRLVVGVAYPGLEFSDIDPVMDSQSELEAVKRAYACLTAVRENSTAFLPPTGHPFAATNPRTGLIAVSRLRRDENRYLDAVGAPAHERGEVLGKDAAIDRLAKDFLGSEAENSTDPPWRFPRHFESAEAAANNPAFPFTGDDRRIGVVHADLSGLGQVFQSLMGTAGSSQDIFDVATAIEKAIADAARVASKKVLLPHAINPSSDPKRFGHLLGPRDGKCADRHGMRIVPARPVLLGGDDLTIIVRADLAVAFSECFLQSVERETEKTFKKLGKKHKKERKRLRLPERLSACAGVAIVSAGQPFTVAERLAEGLCDSAKAQAKSAPNTAPYPSFLDFAVVTSTIDESLASWRRREQTIEAEPTAGEPVMTAAGPRRVCAAGPDTGAAGDSLKSLFVLAETLNAVPGRGKLLESLGLRHESKCAAETAWKRFWQVLKGDAPEARKQLYNALTACAPAAGNGDPPDIPDPDRSIAVVSDALELLDIGAAPRPQAGEGGAKA